MKNDVIYNKKFPTVVLVESVKPLDDFRVRVTFTDGVEREIDLKPVIWGPVFERIRNDPDFFRQVFVDPVSQTLTWPNGVDLDPESLYYGDEEPPWYQDKTNKRQARKPRARTKRTATTGDVVHTKELVYHKKYAQLPRVTAVQVLDGFRVHVTFSDGLEKDIDLEKYLEGPAFEGIRNDPDFFRQVFIDPIGKTLAWPGEVDIDPDTLYYDGPPPWAIEYEQRLEKKKQRQLRARKARKATKVATTARKAAKAATTKKRAVKARPARKRVLAKNLRAKNLRAKTIRAKSK